MGYGPLLATAEAAWYFILKGAVVWPAALYQLTLANREAGPFRGPVKGTPLPTAAPS